MITVSTRPEKAWKTTYNLEVVAVDATQEISAPITIHVTKDPQDDTSLDLFTDRLVNLPETLEYSVVENVAGEEFGPSKNKDTPVVSYDN